MLRASSVKVWKKFLCRLRAMEILWICALLLHRISLHYGVHVHCGCVQVVLFRNIRHNTATTDIHRYDVRNIMYILYYAVRLLHSSVKCGKLYVTNEIIYTNKLCITRVYGSRSSTVSVCSIKSIENKPEPFKC